jgi:hypothetical protein
MNHTEHDAPHRAHTSAALSTRFGKPANQRRSGPEPCAGRVGIPDQDSIKGCATCGRGQRRGAAPAGGRRPRPQPGRPQTPQNTPETERLTQVTITEPAHPLFGRTFPLLRDVSPRGKTQVTILLPNGQRRIVPRSATNLVGANTEQPAVGKLPIISVRTILPVAQFVKAKLGATKEKTDALPSLTSSGGDARSDPAQEPSTSHLVEAVGAEATDAAGPTMGETGAADPTSEWVDGGERC